MKKLLSLFAFTIVYVLAGCGGGGLSGKYAGKATGIEAFSLDFKSGDKVLVTTIAGTTEATYKVEGDNLVVSASGGNTVFTMDRKAGTLTGGPMGLTLQKTN